VTDYLFPTHWHGVAAVTALLLLAGEAGFRLGSRVRARSRQEPGEQVATVQAALLGLLGLLLGFTFAMSVSRYDTRKELVLEEANAIGTAHLRADFLSEPQRSEIRSLLADYVAARLEFYAAGAERERFQHALRRAAGLQSQLSQRAVAAARDHPDPLSSLFVQSLNEVIDLDARRVGALENHVPLTVWLLVVVVAATALWATGYATGLGGRRRALPLLVTPALVAMLIAILVDLDRPRRGLIRVSQDAMTRLQSDLGAR
jgi:hypothetical protein